MPICFQGCYHLKVPTVTSFKNFFGLVRYLQPDNNILILHLFSSNQSMEIFIANCLSKRFLRYLSNNSIILHNNLVIKNFIRIFQKLLTITLTFSCHYISIFQFFQRSFNNNHQFLKSNNTPSKNRFLSLIRTDFHLIN